MVENGWLELAKVFAGPVATVIAAAAAVGVTVVFNRRQLEVTRQQAATAEAQKEIARAQRDIAYDKLKHDLFDKRYAIFIAARSLIELVLKEPNPNLLDPELRRLRLQLDEARFFFPPQIRALCEAIEEHVKRSLTATHIKATQSHEYYMREGLSDQKADADMGLVEIYENLAKRFEQDLGFDQLTKETLK